MVTQALNQLGKNSGTDCSDSLARLYVLGVASCEIPGSRDQEFALRRYDTSARRGSDGICLQGPHAAALARGRVGRGHNFVCGRYANGRPVGSREPFVDSGGLCRGDPEPQDDGASRIFASACRGPTVTLAATVVDGFEVLAPRDVEVRVLSAAPI